ATFDPPTERVFIANGLNFPDALAGGAVAARDGNPILLVTPGSIPAATRAELERLDPQEIVILGETGAVSAAVATELATYAGDVIRLGGANRYETAIAISTHFYGPGVDRLFVAT